MRYFKLFLVKIKNMYILYKSFVYFGWDYKTKFKVKYII